LSAKQVIEAIDIVIKDPDRRALEAIPTENLEAYDFYLQGNDYLKTRLFSKSYIQMSINMFEKAVNLDPRFALAHAKLSDARSNLYWWGNRTDDELAAGSKAAAERALQIDPDLPEAHLALGHYFYHVKFDFDKALEQLTIASVSDKF
jgi:tetratricopeptide (TPR) repeat protein